jgi:hypothetical protein
MRPDFRTSSEVFLLWRAAIAQHRGAENGYFPPFLHLLGIVSVSIRKIITKSGNPQDLAFDHQPKASPWFGAQMGRFTSSLQPR